MCTLSFVARDRGYLVAMNRDERITRGAGGPPGLHELKCEPAIYPSDGAGGTWIAVNEHGIALALLNWNDAAGRFRKTASRGKVIPALIVSRSSEALKRSINGLDLNGMLPFRLTGIFPAERQICEWRWHGNAMVLQNHPWKARHWFSSSLSDHQAEEQRGAECNRAWGEPDAGSVSWIRRLHASHSEGQGAFSLCVHRENVQTLSYSEIACTPALVELGHFVGSPCASGPIQSLAIERANRCDSLVFQKTP